MIKHNLIRICNGELDSTNNSIYVNVIDKYHTDNIHIFDKFITRDNSERSGIRYYLETSAAESLFLYIVNKKKRHCNFNFNQLPVTESWSRGVCHTLLGP